MPARGPAVSRVFIVVEYLDPRTWAIAHARAQHERAVGADVEIRYLDATAEGLAAAGEDATRLEFRLVDVRDERGDLVRLRIPWIDFFDVQDDIVSSLPFREIMDGARGHVLQYLARATVAFDESTGQAVWPGLFLSAVTAWIAPKGATCVLLLRRRVWQDAISAFGARNGVEIVPVGRVATSRKGLLLSVAGRFAGSLRALYLLMLDLRTPPRERVVAPAAPDPMRRGVVCEYYGQLNLDAPEQYSDLFWWQHSKLPGDDITLAFRLAQDPLDARKAAELVAHEVRAIALDPRARSVVGVPVFHHLRVPRHSGLRIAGSAPEHRWLRQRVAAYEIARDYWRDFFGRYGVAAYVSWFKYSVEQAAIVDAAADAGTAYFLYQRSHEDCPSPETAAFCDVFFGYSPNHAAIEKASGSQIGYHVATGYLGDHRFELLKPAATTLRAELVSAGAQRVISFFDENSLADERKHTGHSFMRTNYEEVARRVLKDPTLGVIFKPKTPATLRERLGDVATLLAEAEATGRCRVIERGVLAGSFPPAYAALASDVAIHGHLVAATAGVEAALAGVPTVLLDREGWSASPFHKLDATVSFGNWELLWSALDEYFSGSLPGFGQWGSLLDEIDPFRDGRAAERMGTFLHDYLHALDHGADRDSALADAAERYTATWGDWSIEPVRSDYPRTPSARTGGVRS